jgi:hypothetical protein
MSSHASSSRASGGAIALAIAAPLVWLTMLEAGYLLSHWACGTGMKWPLLVVTTTAAILLGALWSLTPKPAGEHDNPSARFLAISAAWMTIGFLLLAFASTIQPLIIPPCG